MEKNRLILFQKQASVMLLVLTDRNLTMKELYVRQLYDEIMSRITKSGLDPESDAILIQKQLGKECKSICDQYSKYLV